MRFATRLAAAALPLAALLAASPARGVDFDLAGKPALVDITNTSVVNYRFDNRDDSLFRIPVKVNDFYGEWLDRLNVQASWWRFRAGVRVDAATFFLTPSRADVAATVADERNLLEAAQKDPNAYTNDFYRELHSRYVRALYPSKLFIGYNQPGVDVTVGDFYVQLGRGLVFSVRKVDELAVDTTVRGVKVVADRDFGPVHVGGTLFGGQMNPIRVDEQSGRRLHGEGSPLFFGFPRAGDLETYSPQPGRVFTVIDRGRASYLEDTVVGGRLEAGVKWATLAANTSLLLRRSHTDDYYRCLNAFDTQKDGRQGSDTIAGGDLISNGWCASRYPEFTAVDPAKMHNRILTFSGSLSIPSIFKQGDLYVEVAGQQLRDGHPLYAQDQQAERYKADGRATNLSGYAVYVNATAAGGPLAVSLEGKHYRSFFPLTANIDTTTPAFGASEFSLVTYNQPPTVEPIYTQIIGGSPNVCVTGGRARVDYRFNRETSAYAWVGRYASWSENPAHLNPECVIDPKLQTNTWDSAVGVDLGLEGGKSHVRAWIGARTTDRVFAEDTPGGLTNTYYREGYIRYDMVKHLGGRFSLQFQGFHRRRYEPIAFEHPWSEGENYTALQWSPHLSAVFGYEYLGKHLCQPERPASLGREGREAKDLCHYVNGGLQWRANGAGTGAAKVMGKLFDTVAVFVGQRRSAIRCVSGVCRLFPPFEGAKIEITSRF